MSELAKARMTVLYGFGRRGVATHSPETTLNNGWAPIPLTADREKVEAAIRQQNEKYGLGVLHVIEYVVEDE